MKINITGRHITVSDNLKQYAEKKIEKLTKYFHQLIDAHIIMYIEKLDHASEVIINGDGVQFHGREKSGDLFSSIDLLFEKMEKQIIKYKEKHSSHKILPQSEIIKFDYENEQGNRIKLNQVSNKPFDKIEAYLQMQIDNNDFILFKKGVTQYDTELDLSNKLYAVIYRGEDGVKMVKVPFEKLKEQKLEHDTFVEYHLNIIDDSPANPNIEFKRSKDCKIEKLSLNEAVDKFEKSSDSFLTFFNIDSQYFNVVYSTGKETEIMVPAF